MARGGRENSNPAKTTTHSGTVEKETHYINVVEQKGKREELLQIKQIEIANEKSMKATIKMHAK